MARKKHKLAKKVRQVPATPEKLATNALLEQQRAMMGQLGATIARLLNQPYEGGNKIFIFIEGSIPISVTVTIYRNPPESEMPPSLVARVETSGQRDTFYLKFHPTNGTLVGLMSARIGSAWHTSAVTLMEGWPTDLHPHLRAIFVTLCQQLDALRQPAAG